MGDDRAIEDFKQRRGALKNRPVEIVVTQSKAGARLVVRFALHYFVWYNAYQSVCLVNSFCFAQPTMKRCTKQSAQRKDRVSKLLIVNNLLSRIFGVIFR